MHLIYNSDQYSVVEFGADQGRNRAPGVVDCRFCLLSIVMNTRCIAEKILQGAHHRVGSRRIHRCRRVVIEVNAHALSRMLAHGGLALTHSKIRARHVWDGHLYLAVPHSRPGVAGLGVSCHIPKRVGEVTNVEA